MSSVVCVLVPFRDAGDTIDAALDGLLARPDPWVQVLALDDGSTDGGPSVVRDRSQRDPRVRLISCHGRGLVAALQRGVTEGDAPLLARMDADDRCHPDRLTLQVERMQGEPRLGALGCLVRATGSPGEGLQRYVQWQNGLRSVEDHRRELFVESPLCHPSVMMRREALLEVGGYRDLPGPEDYDLWLRLDAAGWGLAKLPRTLLDWEHAEGRATFSDPRYALERFRETKAPYLSARVVAADAKELAWWGAGPTGKRLARAAERHGLRPDFFVDIDPRKIGSRARGVAVRSPDALDPRRHSVVVAVGARGARQLIREDLVGRGFEEGVNAWFAA